MSGSKTLGFTSFGSRMRFLRQETLYLFILHSKVSDLGFRVPGLGSRNLRVKGRVLRGATLHLKMLHSEFSDLAFQDMRV